MKTLTEKRFFEWHEDDVSVTLRNKGGSYGGGQKCLSYVIAADFYNQSLTGDVTMPICASRSDPDHLPCVIEVWKS
jgi:hypothetical protein